eukprot:4732083-Amphidinium_carterae.1
MRLDGEGFECWSTGSAHNDGHIGTRSCPDFAPGMKEVTLQQVIDLAKVIVIIIIIINSSSSSIIIKFIINPPSIHHHHHHHRYR